MMWLTVVLVLGAEQGIRPDTKVNMQQHTLLLVQPTRSLAGRTYSDYDSVAEAMDGMAACTTCIH